MGDNSEGSEVIVLIPSSREAQKIEEPGGLQERPSYHMHLTLHLWVGAKRFSDVSTHACLHLIHSSCMQKRFANVSRHIVAPTSVRYSGML